MKRILFIFGTRPEAIKLCPVIRHIRESNGGLQALACVTAQHRAMLDQVLDCFELQPDYDLNLMQPGQTLFQSTARIIEALEQPIGCVLLIDEIDKSDAEFESLLLEILSDFQVTIPELGTITAVAAPTVILTSNSERDLGDALKRRCLHLHIGFPEQKLEERIVESRVPGISQTLRKQMVSFINDVRTLDLKKQPSVSETIDWARVLVLLQATELGHEMVKDTLNVLLKYETDIEAALPQVTTFVAKASRQNVFG